MIMVNYRNVRYTALSEKNSPSAPRIWGLGAARWEGWEDLDRTDDCNRGVGVYVVCAVAPWGATRKVEMEMEKQETQYT